MDRVVVTARVGFTLNGAPVEAAPAPGERLSWTLRERLGAREVKVGCEAGDCGACTILVDGAPVCACLMAAQQAEGRVVETAAALAATDPVGKRVARHLLDHGAVQCGICTPAMLAAAVALLREDPAPTEAAISEALGGVLCRCTGYRKIIAAVRDAAGAEIAALPRTSAGSGAVDSGAGHVGAAIPRLDGGPRVSGAACYGDDIAPPAASGPAVERELPGAAAETLFVRAIRAPFHRASFTLGDLDAFCAAHPGIVRVLSAADVPGRNRFGVIPGFEDQPVFAEAETRFRGEAVAAVVGSFEAVSSLDPGDFPVRWTELPACLTPDAALAPDAPQIQPGRPGNVMAGGHVRRGDAEAALATAAHRVAGRFTTSFVEHAYVEPEAGFARFENGRLTLHVCTQSPWMNRAALAAVTGLAPRDIRITPTAVGGGFGSKLDLSVHPLLALAAMATGRPVRMAFSRPESMAVTTKRHAADISMTLAADSEGRFTAITAEATFNTGAHSSWGPTVATRVPIHASGPYVVPNYRAEARGVYTHVVPAGAFRGFGVPQAAIALESLIDTLAERLGADPLELRLANALRDGLPTVTGQVFAQGVGMAACLEALRPAWREARAAAEAFNARAAAAGSPLRRGAGLASGWYGCGNTALPNPSTIRAGVTAEGELVLHQGAVDIGQGAETVITQIFATALGVPTQQVRRLGADTALTPDAGKTSASRQTFVTGNAARLAGAGLRRTILARVNASDAATIALQRGAVVVTDASGAHRIDLSGLPLDEHGYVFSAEESYDPPVTPLDENGQGSPYAQFGYAAHLAEVEVDCALGTVRPIRVVAAHDVGRAINPLLVEGQIQGGVAQGIGMALMEEFLPGRNENLHDYLVPTTGDVPPVECHIVEAADAEGPFGAKGLGEHALIPTAPAILNAIAHATGVRMRHVPVTPARLFHALREAGHV